LLVIRRLARACRAESGFGLIEVLIGMLVMTVGVGALMMVFVSSLVGLRHTGKEGTAISIADRLLEQYRAMPFSNLPTSLTPPSNTSSCPTPSAFPDTTIPCQQVTATNSPDHRPYVATTTANSSTVTPSAGTPYTQITITVAVQNNGSEMARETSYFTSLDSTASS
jgi:type II secretory pathway pseudopilin PulG